MGKSKKRRHSSSSSDSYDWEVKKTHENKEFNQDSQAQEPELKSRDDDLFAAMLNRVASAKGNHRATSSNRRPFSGLKRAEPINIDDPNIAGKFINSPTGNLEMSHSSFEDERCTDFVDGNHVEGSINRMKEVVERYVTNDDINAMSAQIMKAELMGNKDKIAKLKSKLDKLHEARRRNIKVRLMKSVTTSSKAKSTKNVVQLTTINDLGCDVPLHIRRYQGSSRDYGHKHERVNYHDDQGCRTKYLPDDNESGTVEDLIRQEKLEMKNSYDRQFVSLAGRVIYRFFLITL